MTGKDFDIANIQFAHPEYFWLLLVLIPLTVWYVLKHKNSRPLLLISHTGAFAQAPRSWKPLVSHICFALRMAVVACVIVILARPQTHNAWHTSTTEGTEIMLALDVSTSMLTRDLKPNRMEAAKKVAQDFIDGRESDAIGVVIFAGESLTGVPLTNDYAPLQEYIAGLDRGMITDGTAIGDGLATALNRLENGKAESKSVILVTDGSNNTGISTPLMAAEAAKELGVKVYTVGIGSQGVAEAPSYIDAAGRIIYEKQKVTCDEEPLKQIAAMTGGEYFAATNEDALAGIFERIDALEKTKMDINNFTHTTDTYELWAWLAVLLFVLELVLRYTVLRSIP